MSFFRETEFASCCHSSMAKMNCDYANAKLEKHSTLVYGNYNMPHCWFTHPAGQTHRAILINIEKIEVVCEHPHNKVLLEPGETTGIFYHRCACGLRVKPSSFVVAE